MELSAGSIGKMRADPLIGASAVLCACRASFLELSSDHHWLPLPNSLADRDRTGLADADPGTSTLSQPAGFTLIGEVVATYLEIGSLHADAMAHLCAVKRLMLPIEALARAALEATSYAIWVLGAGEDDFSSRDRLARTYLCEFESAARHKSMSALQGGANNPGSSRRSKVLQRCRTVFPDATTNLVEKGQLGGQQFPGPTEVVRRFLSHALDSGAIDLPEQMVGAIYGYLSSGTHPALFRLREIRRFVPHSDHQGTQLVLPIETLTSTARLVSGLYTVALRTTADYFGWEGGACDHLYDVIEAAYPDAITS